MRTASELTPRARPVGEPALHVVRHAPADPSAAAGPAHAHSRAAGPAPRFPGAPLLRLRPLPWDLVVGGVRALLSPCLVLKALGLHSLPPPPTRAHSHSHTHARTLARPRTRSLTHTLSHSHRSRPLAGGGSGTNSSSRNSSSRSGGGGGARTPRSGCPLPEPDLSRDQQQRRQQSPQIVQLLPLN